MFNRPQPSKRAKAWRPEPGLLSQNSSRGFATTRWGGAEDGFMVDDIKRTKDGFALDEYAQVPLSPQAIAALKRLKAMEPDENVVIAEEVFEAPEKFQIETFGITKTEAQTKGICIRCKKPAQKFKSEISRREYGLSAFCQKCQDSIFKEDD